MSRLRLLAFFVASLSVVAAADDPARLIITNTEYVLDGVHLSDVAAFKMALQGTTYKELRIVPSKDTSYERVRAALEVIQKEGGISVGIVGDRPVGRSP